MIAFFFVGFFKICFGIATWKNKPFIVLVIFSALKDLPSGKCGHPGCRYLRSPVIKKQLYLKFLTYIPVFAVIQCSINNGFAHYGDLCLGKMSHTQIQLDPRISVPSFK